MAQHGLIGLFPQWYLPNFGSGYIVALYASIHMLLSHISVGSSFLVAYFYTKAYKNNDEQLFRYVKQYLLRFLIYPYIIGSVTGPGIWFSTTVSAPRGISSLIHNFVWVWGAEEIFFISEVMLIYILYYNYERIARRTFMHWTWGFAFLSWGTMLLIVGILSFMLTPGQRDTWAQTGNMLYGFWTANYFPHVFMRTSFMFALAALLGLVVAVYIKNPKLKQEIVRELSLIGMTGIFFGGVFLYWYLRTIPGRSELILTQVIPQPFLLTIGLAVLGLTLFFALYFIWPRLNQSRALLVALFIGVLALAIFPSERAREWMRKPYVAGEFMYVNQVIARDVPGRGMQSELPLLAQEGMLKAHPFVPARVKTITPENELEAGRAMAMIACANCHSLDERGPRPLVLKMQGVNNPEIMLQFLERRLGGDMTQGQAPYMPILAATEAEKRALANYLVELNRQFLEKKAKNTPLPYPLLQETSSLSEPSIHRATGR